MKFCPQCGKPLKDATFDVKTGDWHIVCEVHGKWRLTRTAVLAQEGEAELRGSIPEPRVLDLRSRVERERGESTAEREFQQSSETSKVGAGFAWLFSADAGQVPLCPSCFYYGRTRVGLICNFFGTYNPKEFVCSAFKPNPRPVEARGKES